MGHFDQLLHTLGVKPKKAPVLAKAMGDETREQLRARLAAKPKKRAMIVLAKSLPAAEKPKPLGPKDMAELRALLDEAVIGGKISGTDARDICHQLAAGKQLPDDLAIQLGAILRIRAKPHSYDNAKRTPQMKAELHADLAQAVAVGNMTAAQAAKAEQLPNSGAELADDLKMLIGRYTR